MSQDKLPDPGGKPSPVSIPVRLAKTGAYGAGAVLLAGGGLIVLVASLTTPTLGATHSMQLVWKNRQRVMDEAARADVLDQADPAPASPAINLNEK